MVYIEENGDITKQDGYVIAHCISVDCAMGAGVVIPICKKNTQLKDRCRDIAKKSKMMPGFIIRYQDSKGVVYNMFTKEKYWYNSTRNMAPGEYEKNLKEALVRVKNSMIKHNEIKLAMPRIGCGLDRCNWNNISSLIKEVFSDTEIEIKICVL